MDTLSSQKKVESVPLTTNQTVTTHYATNPDPTPDRSTTKDNKTTTIIATIAIILLVLLLLALLLFLIFRHDKKSVTTVRTTIQTTVMTTISSSTIPKVIIPTSGAMAMVRSAWNFIPVCLGIIIMIIF